MTKPRAGAGALKLVVLDCDGVMFDSREANRAYYSHLRETFGRPPLTEEEVSYVHTHSAPQSVPYLFRAWPGDLERVEEYRRRVDYTPFLGRMAMEPDLLDFLRTVRRTMRTAISTNRTSTMDAVLTTFGLRPWFDLVVTASDVVHPKPHVSRRLIDVRPMNPWPALPGNGGPAEKPKQHGHTTSGHGRKPWAPL